MEEASRRLRELAQAIRGCTACPLGATRHHAVPGEGRPGASVFFVGEAPGRREDATGRPFIGPAGRMLNLALQRAGLRREDAFITSTVKCKPPDKEKPTRREVATCTGLYLFHQIEAVDPIIIVTLGNYGLQALFGPRATVGAYGGRELAWRRWPLRSTYHPAAALWNPRARKGLYRDLRWVARYLHARAAASALPPPSKPPGGRSVRGNRVIGGSRPGHRGRGH